MPGALLIGAEITLDVEAFAHGGHCVGRHDGRVVFVRHALPGERVTARITEDRGGAFCRADAVAVLVASPDRVEPPCRYARPGGCGGCDLQHARPAAQRALKAGVVREQLIRLGGLPAATVDALLGEGEIEELPGGMLGWRTRVRFAIDVDGRAGLRKHRSHEVVPLERCAVATAGVDELGVTGRAWPGIAAVEAVAAGSGDRALVLEPLPGHPVAELRTLAAGLTTAVLATVGKHPAEALRGHQRVREDAAGRRWLVRADGFWQVHPGAADALTGAVLTGLAPRPGETALDLYAGAGLFAGAVAAAVGPGGRVVAVESDPGAVADARRNLRDLPWTEVIGGRVDQALARRGSRPDLRRGRRHQAPRRPEPPIGPADLVVLDPPRSGAGAVVVAAIAARAPRAVAYVACDPAALARDVATFGAAGYRLTALRAFDAFPMTHHVECVATFHPAG